MQITLGTILLWKISVNYLQHRLVIIAWSTSKTAWNTTAFTFDLNQTRRKLTILIRILIETAYQTFNGWHYRLLLLSSIYVILTSVNIDSAWQWVLFRVLDTISVCSVLYILKLHEIFIVSHSQCISSHSLLIENMLKT
jgi:hypothetical protein